DLNFEILAVAPAAPCVAVSSDASTGGFTFDVGGLDSRLGLFQTWFAWLLSVGHVCILFIAPGFLPALISVFSFVLPRFLWCLVCVVRVFAILVPRWPSSPCPLYALDPFLLV
ncbi:hypothetical protein U1Q18_017510, partial [Sarracenia purpurea var. burkii]